MRDPSSAAVVSGGDSSAETLELSVVGVGGIVGVTVGGDSVGVSVGGTTVAVSVGGTAVGDGGTLVALGPHALIKMSRIKGMIVLAINLGMVLSYFS